jgi:hypothetical protein
VIEPASVDLVLAANQAFYDAHEQRDLQAMGAVWEHSDRAVCVHPGWPILRTWPVVLASWQRILGGPGRNQFIVTNTSVTVVEGVTEDVAWVTLDENLVEGQVAGTIAATNMFVRTGGAWLLVHHHGSPVLA